MTRVMLDSNAIDAVLKYGDVDRIRAAGIAVAITTAQEDEIHQIAGAAKRQALFDLLYVLQARRIAPADLPWDAGADAVIAATAAQTCDLLVSDDKSIAHENLRVLTYSEFRKEYLP